MQKLQSTCSSQARQGGDVLQWKENWIGIQTNELSVAKKKKSSLSGFSLYNL